MSARIVAPAEHHREQIANVLSTSLNVPLERAMQNAPNLQLADIRVALVDEKVVAVAGEFRFDQWFGGRAIACSGITRVATLPEHRASGLATACNDAVLVAARERGAAISALFPAVLRPYRRMGFEVAGTYAVHRLPLDSITPDHDAPRVSVADADQDLTGIRDAYRASIRDSNGPVEPVEDEHWRRRILARAGDDAYRSVVVREEDRVTGFAAFSRENTPGALDVSFGLTCEALFATTPAAWRSLLTYFRGFRGVGAWVQWAGPPSDPLALATPEALLHKGFAYDWMLRLLDVPAALSARGYAAIDAEAIIAVEDERWPENAGPWRIELNRGKASVTQADAGAEAPRPMSIRTLSAMFSGFLRAPDAVRLGLLDADDSSVGALAQMFSGPDPWCPFFF